MSSCHKIVYKDFTPKDTEYSLLSFDFDDTLVPGTVKKSSFAIPIDVIYARIDRFLNESPFPVVLAIFSNQYSLGKKKTTLECVTARFDAFISDLRSSPVYSRLLAVYTLFAPEKDSYRKPFTGMYDSLVTDLGNLRQRFLSVTLLGARMIFRVQTSTLQTTVEWTL